MSETPACTMLLPRNLAALAKCASKETTARYAVAGIQLERTTEGYRASATDCRSAAMVEGPLDDASEYPPIPALCSAPNSATTAIIAAKFWADAFKAIPKRSHKPILQRLAVVMGETITTLASTDMEQDKVSTPRNVEGRFPNLQDAIPTSKSKLASVRVDAKRLAELLTIAAEYTEDGYTGVTIELHGEKPIVIRAASPTQKFTGVIVPLNVDKPQTSAQRDKELDAEHKPQPGRNVFRAIACLMNLWSGHAAAMDAIPKYGTCWFSHKRLTERCQKAHANLTAKYLS